MRRLASGMTVTDTVPTAVRKSFQILEALAASPRPVSGLVLAESLGLTRSTLSRLALSLAALGYLERVEGLGWQLGPAALRLGLARLANLDIRGIAAPLMRALSEEVDLPVDLAMPVGDEMLHFELAQKAGQVVVASEMGARLPIARTALGHAALFAMEARRREQTLRRLRDVAGADWAAQDAAIAASFAQLAQTGFCIVIGQLRADVAAIGAPFVDPRGGGIFSFSCSAFGFAVEARSLEAVGPRLLRMVRQVGAAMGAAAP
ncbi:IclR family transcriptional regulator [Roseomonas aerophila]|uniref:IclR family transcriptional regulator n=1 Tax=Teichococcus aerophilus TaxID=1224513 RepID=A0ABR7RGS5_9PROT|nr:IclR family transcriptional regulator [Pseudoroseomonas aerophila]